MINYYLLGAMGFLLIMIIFSAIYFGYGKGIKRFQNYISMNRSMGSVPLAIAMITLTISGSLLQLSIGDILIHGVSDSITRALVYSITSFIFASYIFPTLLKFRNSYSLGGVIKHMYGQTAATITSILVSMVCLHTVYYELVKLAHIAPMFSTHQYGLLTLAGIAGTLQALWISSRRISTVAIIQLLLVMGLLFSLSSTVLASEEVKACGGGLQGLLQAIKNNVQIQQGTLLNYRPSWGSILNVLQVPVLFIYPPFIQRVLINKDSRQMKHALGGVAIAHICVGFLLIIIGLGAALITIKKYGVIFGDFDVILASLSQNGWIGLCYSYLVLISSIGIMSYFLYSISVELSQNVLKPFWGNEAIKNDNRWNQLIIFIMGALCIILALLSQKGYYNLLSPLLIFMEALLAPFLIGCIGFKGNRVMFIMGFTTFYLTTMVLLLGTYYGYLPIRPGLALHRQLARTNPIAILMSSIVILITHYIIYNKFSLRQSKQKVLFKRQYSGDSFRKMLSNPLVWAQKKFGRYDNQPSSVGAFLLLILVLPNLASSYGLGAYHGTVLFVVRIIGIILATVMMLHHFFPYYIKHIFPLLWFIVLGYCIPFCHAFFVLCAPHSPILIVKLALLILFLRVVVDWRTCLLLTCVGLLGAYICYQQFIPYEVATISFQERWNIFEMMVLVFIITIFFMTYQEKVNNEYVTKNKGLASGFSHDLRNLFQYLHWLVDHQYNDESILQILNNIGDNLKRNSKEFKALVAAVVSVRTYLEECLKECQVFYDLVKNEYINPKDIEEVDIEELIKETVFFVPNHLKKNIEIIVDKSSKVKIHPTVVKSALLNLIKNGFKHGLAKKVTIGWDDKNSYLYVKDNGKGVEPGKEAYIFDLHYTTGGTGVGLPFIKIMLQKMHASIFFETGSKGTTFFVKLPLASRQ